MGLFTVFILILDGWQGRVCRMSADQLTNMAIKKILKSYLDTEKCQLGNKFAFIGSTHYNNTSKTRLSTHIQLFRYADQSIETRKTRYVYVLVDFKLYREI